MKYLIFILVLAGCSTTKKIPNEQTICIEVIHDGDNVTTKEVDCNESGF